MEKSADAFRTISEVATELDVPQHVLRFWEGKFPQIKPLKRAGGRRYYRPQDVDLLRAIKRLLYAEGFTIKGVQRILKEKGARAICTTSREPPWAAASLSGTHGPSDVEDLALPDEASDTTEDASPSIVLAGPEEKAPGDAAGSEPGSVEVRPASSPRLCHDAADVERLREILAELEHCAEVLAAARRA